MKKNAGFLYVLILLGAGMFFLRTAYAQTKLSISNETTAQKIKRMQWWTDDRFGMFIHWGLYALPARHEWVKNQERISNDTYQKYFVEFNPDLFNPKKWAKEARAVKRRAARRVTNRLAVHAWR